MFDINIEQITHSVSGISGATLGDTLTKTPEQGGLGLGTIGTSAVLVAITVVGIIYVTRNGYHWNRNRATVQTELA